jgi:hypothetical protein
LLPSTSTTCSSRRTASSFARKNELRPSNRTMYRQPTLTTSQQPQMSCNTWPCLCHSYRNHHWRMNCFPACMRRITSSLHISKGRKLRLLHRLARTHSHACRQIPRRTSGHDQRPPGPTTKKHPINQTESETQGQETIRISRTSRNSFRTTTHHPRGMMQPRLSHLLPNN